MNYSVNPKKLGAIFALPSCIVDDHIKLASEYQLKCLLIFIKNQADDNVYSNIAKTLSLTENEVAECLDYWVQRGILINNESSSIKVEKTAKTVIKDISTSKPTREEAVRRIASSEELKYLTAVAQEKLSRPITAAELRTFVWLYDNYGLPVPVIIQAIQYAHDSGRLNFSYIEKVCVDWAKNDITTLSKAEERLNMLYLSKTAWKMVENAFGIEHRKPSANEKKYAEKWVNEFGFNKDMLVAAYDVCTDKTAKLNFKYIDSVLCSWYKAGFKKPSDITDTQTDKKAAKTAKTPSYSLENIKKKINNFD